MEMNKWRQELILNRMEELGMISEAECRDAKAEKLIFTISEEYKAAHRQEGEDGEAGKENDRRVYSWFEDAAIEDAIQLVMEAKGCSEKIATSLVYSGGYHIYTTLNPEIQSIVDSVYRDTDYFASQIKSGSPLDSAMTVVDPYTGHVVAMAGGVGEKTVNRSLNLATSPRQPGSSIKPFLPLDGFSSLVKNQVTIGVWVHFWVFNSIPLVYLSVSIPVPCSFYHNCSVVKL